MLAVIASLVVISVILAVAEILWRKKILKGENQRKFVHISIGTFAAFWPWLMSWEAIQLLGLIMTVGVLLNRHRTFLHYLGNIRITHNYGDVFLPIAIVIASLVTTNKIFFAIAILHVSLADGLAAVVGKNLGRHWKYKIFKHSKTVVGSMTFWLVSVCILGVGILAAHDSFSYDQYSLLLLTLPPMLMIIENVVGFGMDNIAVPAAVLVALNLAV
ncbi:hypothetical protein H0X09_00890 [Candidatus Saccharibacteria bacterium]|nr:hypothetical protein [Candidatus Saccharibacteria bacterium]